MNRYLINLFILFFINSGSAFTNADLNVLIKFQDKIEYLLNLNYRTIYKKLECSEKYLDKARNDVKKEDPICFAHLNEIFSSGRDQLKKLRIAKALSSTPIPFFLDLAKDQYYVIPEKAYIQYKIKHEIIDIKVSEFNFQNLVLEDLTTDEVTQAKERFNNFLENSLNKFTDLPEFKSNLSIITNSEKMDLIERFHKIALTPQNQRVFTSAAQKITFENLMIHFNKYLKSQYQFKFRKMLQDEYENILTQFPYLSLVSGPTNMKGEILNVFKKMLKYSYLSLDQVQMMQKDDSYSSLKDKFLLNNDSIDEGEKEFLLKKLQKNFGFDKVSEYFSKDIESSEEKKAFIEQLMSHKKQEAVKQFAHSGFLLTTTVLCLLPIGQSSRALWKIFNFARTGTAKIACSVALFTPVSIFYLLSNQEKYERAYQLFYSRGDTQGLFMEYNKLTQYQQNYLLDLILSPLNLMVVTDAIKASRIFSSHFKQKLIEKLQ